MARHYSSRRPDGTRTNAAKNRAQQRRQAIDRKRDMFAQAEARFVALVNPEARTA